MSMFKKAKNKLDLLLIQKTASAARTSLKGPAKEEEVHEKLVIALQQSKYSSSNTIKIITDDLEEINSRFKKLARFMNLELRLLVDLTSTSSYCYKINSVTYIITAENNQLVEANRILNL